MDPGALWTRLMAGLEQAHPVPFFLAMVLLPLGPFPASVLFVSAGIRFGVVGGFALGMAALSLNMSLSYLLARRVIRRPLEGWCRRRGLEVPSLARKEEVPFLLLFRITPGMPLVVQNYVLGLSGIRFSLYLPISLMVQVPYVLGFAWIGQSLTQTSVWKVAMGVGGVVALGLAVRLIRNRFAPAARGGRVPAGIEPHDTDGRAGSDPPGGDPEPPKTPGMARGSGPEEG